jgi:hypothetical protein
MNVIKRRLERIASSMQDTESFIMVYIGDSEDPDTDGCSARKETCPPFPCNDHDECWVKKKYPNMKKIKVGLKEEDD